MKKNFLILCFLLANAVYSQNNLQFSKVITESFTIASAEYGVGTQFSTLKTVPTGKVWKIESMGSEYEQSSGFELNGIRIRFYLNQSYSNYKGNPIWLSAGTTLRFWNNSSVNNCYFSIIEFNIVQ
jgi:hypothetical protein